MNIFRFHDVFLAALVKVYPWYAEGLVRLCIWLGNLNASGLDVSTFLRILLYVFL